MIHLLFLFALYFLPSLIASARHLHNRPAIILINLFLGWTCIGWFIALIWAIAAPSPCMAYYAPPPYPPYPRYYR